jgi:hypothetical protein
MANFLEQLCAEWYEFNGFLVRRNALVGKRRTGGYEGELDIVAFHPVTSQFVHVEASMDAESWAAREEKFQRKFDVGKRYAPALFDGLPLPAELKQIALLGFAGKSHPTTLGGGDVLVLQELLVDILTALRELSEDETVVPETYSLLRAL